MAPWTRWTRGAVLAVLLGVGGWSANEVAAAPVPKDFHPGGVIWVFHPADGHLIGLSPDGKKLRTVKLTPGTNYGMLLGITRDGQHAFVTGEKGKLPNGKPAWDDAMAAKKLTVHLLPLFTDARPTDTGIACEPGSRYVVLADGKTLVVEYHRPPDETVPGKGRPARETVAFDLSTFKGTKRPDLPERFALAAELPNGDRIAAKEQYGSEKRPLQSFHLFPANGDKAVSLTGEDETDFLSPSPDGRTLLVTRQFPHKTTPTDSFHRMYRIDRATGTAEPFAHRPHTTHVRGVWSPDGSRIVYEWLEEGDTPLVRKIGGGIEPTPIRKARLAVCDPTGKNEKVLLEVEGYEYGGGLEKAQEWHCRRPQLIGWFPAEAGR